MGNVSREKKQKDMLELQRSTKNTVTDMKTAWDGPTSRLNTPESRISEPEDLSAETSKMRRDKD